MEQPTDTRRWWRTFNTVLHATVHSGWINPSDVDDATSHARTMAHAAHGYTPSEYKGSRPMTAEPDAVTPFGT